MPSRKFIPPFTLTAEHKIKSQMECTIIRRIQTSLEMFKTSYSPSDWRNDPFQQKQIEGLYTSKRSHLVYFIQSQSELSQNDQTNAVERSQQTEKPSLSLR